MIRAFLCPHKNSQATALSEFTGSIPIPAAAGETRSGYSEAIVEKRDGWNEKPKARLTKESRDREQLVLSCFVTSSSYSHSILRRQIFDAHADF